MGAENLGIETLSSVLKQHGHKTSLIFDPALFDDKYYLEVKWLARLFKYKTIAQDIIATNPDIVLFSVFSDCNQWALDVARQVKGIKNVPVIFGGIHPTSVPEKSIREDCVDYVVVGEAEDAIVELLDSLEKDQPDYAIPNAWFKKDGQVIGNPVRPLNQNLNALPYPDKDLFAEHVPFKHYMTATARGCLFACTFCCHNFLRKLYVKDAARYVRRRSPDHVIGELKLAKRKYNIKFVSFEDDIFTYDKEWLRKFLPRYKQEIGLPYRAITHPLHIDDEIAKLLKETGCYKLEMGVQTFNEEVKRKMMSRIEKNEDIIRAIKACDTYKLNFFVDHMFGFGETEAELKHALLLYNEYRPVRVTCYWLQYYPETAVLDKTGATEEQKKEAAEGKQNTYITGGSVKDKGAVRMIKNFQFMMKGLRLYPKWMIRFFVSSGMYKMFYIFPPLPFEFLVALKMKDYRIFNYVGYYTFNFRKLLRKKLAHAPSQPQKNEIQHASTIDISTRPTSTAQLQNGKANGKIHDKIETSPVSTIDEQPAEILAEVE